MAQQIPPAPTIDCVARGPDDADAIACSDASEQNAARTVCHRLGYTAARRPVVGIILGSGLGQAAESVFHRERRAVTFQSVPGMAVPRVAGHQGRFVAGVIGGCETVLMQGRVHWYEGHGQLAVTRGVRIMTQLGVQALIVTNAAGGICSDFQPGDLMLIRGHLVFPVIATFAGTSGGSQPDEGRRGDFANAIWDSRLLRCARSTKSELTVHDGVYAMMSGPCYETPAEIRMLRTLGADAVGMSTVPEASLAASRGIPVLGVSCITNFAAGLSAHQLSHAEVTETASVVESRFSDWLHRLIPAVAAAIAAE